jgi:hypothetical protein
MPWLPNPSHCRPCTVALKRSDLTVDELDAAETLLDAQEAARLTNQFSQQLDHQPSHQPSRA